MHSIIAAAGTATVLLLGGSSAGPVTERAAARPPGAVSATVVSAGGSGCPGRPVITAQGTKDPATFSLQGPGVTARAGGSATIADRSRFCQLVISVRAARGWTWTLGRVEQSGRAQLASGAVGTARFSFYWSGDPKTGTYAKSLKGPRDTAWTAADSIGIKRVGWAPCGSAANLNIKTEVSVRSGADRSRISTMSVGGPGNAPAAYRVSWRSC
ncbi:DUF4360 domain-containing protein [Catenuloplanes sp. NPDC051500]|uniref:DUF4360 domain-containing protein n=1 Tax=Catenuloplanes sp. NPDC051500 TaxID=3363959 RepID=UPI0037AD502A